MKANLPGVSYSIVEENIIWLFIVCMNKQGFAADSLRFYSHLGPFPPATRAFRFIFSSPKLFLKDPFVVNDLVVVTLQFLVYVLHCLTTYLGSARLNQGQERFLKMHFSG